MQNIELFNNKEFGDIRIVLIEDIPHFVANDVANALGYKRPRDAVNQHCKGTVKHSVPTKGGKQRMNTITEGDVYRLIISSQLPNAEKFEVWVMEEVLPTIRETGGIVTNTDVFVESMFADAPDDMKVFMKQALQQRQKDIVTIEEQSDIIQEQIPKVQFADAIAGAETNISVGAMAKILKQNGFNIGQNRFFKWLRENGFVMNTVNPATKRTPTQRAVNLGVLALRESHVDIGKDGDKRSIIDCTTRITPKGQDYFITKLCK